MGQVYDVTVWYIYLQINLLDLELSFVITSVSKVTDIFILYLELSYNFIRKAIQLKEIQVSAWNAGDPGLILGSRRSPGEGNGTPLQYSCLENPLDGGAWQAAVHGVTKSQTRLSDFTFTFHFHALEKEMATHSNVLAWRIPWMEEPGRLQSMGSQRVGHT